MESQVALLKVKRELLTQLEGVVIARHNLVNLVNHYDSDALSKEELWQWAMEQVSLDANPFNFDEDEDVEEASEESDETEDEESEDEDTEDEDTEDEESEDEEAEEPKARAKDKFRLLHMDHVVKCNDCSGEILAGEEGYEVKSKGKNLYGCTEECADNILRKVRS